MGVKKNFVLLAAAILLVSTGCSVSESGSGVVSLDSIEMAMTKSSSKKSSSSKIASSSSKKSSSKSSASISSSSVSSSSGTSASVVTFAALGDFGAPTSGAMKQTAVASLIKGFNPDVVISAADVNQGQSGDYSTECGTLYGSYVSSKTFYSALGNHDSSSSFLSYFSYFPGLYYTVTYGPVQFFIIDSNSDTSSSSTQAQWLKSQLAASTTAWQVVVFHHGAYCSSSKHGSTSAMQWSFEAWGADAVISGHNHVYERVLRDDNSDSTNLPYFTVGTGGYSLDSFSSTYVSGSALRYNSNYGALKVTATASSMIFEFYNISGTVVDTYTITK